MPEVECGFLNQPDLLVNLGPTIKVQIGFDQNYSANSGRIPYLPPQDYHALIDTGATESCIDSTIAIALGLPVINERDVSGVHGQAKVNVHLAQIYIPALQFTQYGAFSGVHLHAGGQPHSALLGRTLLRHMTMTHTGGTGSVILSHHPQTNVTTTRASA